MLGPVFSLENDRIAGLLALCAAVGVHAAIAFGSASAWVSPPPLPAIVSEVELAPPPLPVPVLPEVPPPAEEPAPTAPAATTPVAPVRAAPSPAAARAGAIMAADPTAKGSEDMVDFVSDPAGTSYGSGVVTRGGTATHSTGGIARVPPPTAPPARGPSTAEEGVTPSASLSRAARLQGDDPCSGYYPAEATADSGSAVISVVVLPSGKVARVSMKEEAPAGQGFGAAARRCLSSSSFTPALDRAGNIVSAALTVRVRFSR